ESGETIQDRRGDVVREVTRYTDGNPRRGWVLGTGGYGDGRGTEEIAFDHGDVRDRGGSEIRGEVAVDFKRGDGLHPGGERAGERPGARANLDERVVGLRIDRANDLVDPRRLEEVLAEAPAGPHVSSPRQYFSSISSISSSLSPK